MGAGISQAIHLKKVLFSQIIPPSPSPSESKSPLYTSVSYKKAKILNGIEDFICKAETQM